MPARLDEAVGTIIMTGRVPSEKPKRTSADCCGSATIAAAASAAARVIHGKNTVMMPKQKACRTADFLFVDKGSRLSESRPIQEGPRVGFMPRMSLSP